METIRGLALAYVMGVDCAEFALHDALLEAGCARLAKHFDRKDTGYCLYGRGKDEWGNCCPVAERLAGIRDRLPNASSSYSKEIEALGI